MKSHKLHSWNVTPSKARAIQEQLGSHVIRHDLFKSIERVCGVDVSFRGAQSVAACVVMSFPDLEIIEHSVHSSSVSFPYISGLLSFREIPALLPALEAINTDPDLIIVDGQGIAHGRGMGLASHLGILLDTPTIGCAKSKLVGSYAEPGVLRGDWEYLNLGDSVIGAVVRTRQSVKPLFVSIGHGISLHSAVFYILKCCRKYRVTEPIRFAHRLAGGKA